MFARKRIRSAKKTTSRYFNRKIIEKKIRQAPKEGLKCCDLLNILGGSKNFIGVFAANHLLNLKIYSYPIFLICNIDESFESGSHWLAMRISKYEIEIFDSLGFLTELWGKKSPSLSKFLDRFRLTHKFKFSPVLQSSESSSCGLFSVFYIRNRQSFSFKQCCNFFSKNLYLNDRKLLSYFLSK